MLSLCKLCCTTGSQFLTLRPPCQVSQLLKETWGEAMRQVDAIFISASKVCPYITGPDARVDEKIGCAYGRKGDMWFGQSIQSQSQSLGGEFEYLAAAFPHRGHACALCLRQANRGVLFGGKDPVFVKGTEAE